MQEESRSYIPISGHLNGTSILTSGEADLLLLRVAASGVNLLGLRETRIYIYWRSASPHRLSRFFSVCLTKKKITHATCNRGKQHLETLTSRLYLELHQRTRAKLQQLQSSARLCACLRGNFGGVLTLTRQDHEYDRPTPYLPVKRAIGPMTKTFNTQWHDPAECSSPC